MIRIHRLSLAVACTAVLAPAVDAHARLPIGREGVHLAAATRPIAPRVCSMSAFPPFRDNVHTMIATAQPDTLPAGPGAAQAELARGGGPVYGQAVRVERLGGPDAVALLGRSQRVVLVPWGYDEACRPIRWTGSARWVQPGERGLFWAVLRPYDEWVDGLPTFDVSEPFQTPFPQKAHRGGEELLSIEQAFELMQILPLYDEWRTDVTRAMAPFAEWARAHPELACRYPATEVRMFAVDDVADLSLPACGPDPAEGGESGEL